MAKFVVRGIDEAPFFESLLPGVDLRTVRRVVLDFKAGNAAIMYVEHFIDSEALKVIAGGAEITIEGADINDRP